MRCASIRLAAWVAGTGCFLVLTGLVRPLNLSAQSTNGVLREVYQNIAGATIASLTTHPSFPDSPTLETLEPVFESPTSFGENYGMRMRALLFPPATGDYTFWIATDDQGLLYLSTTAEPAQKQQIASVNGWTSVREWGKEPNQRSVPIRLQSGQAYYIEALQKEGGGGDNLAVRWQLPDGTFEEPIPNYRLAVFGLGPPVISRQPINTTALEGGSAIFTVRLQRMLGATFQWLRNGSPLLGATNADVTLGPLFLSDSLSRFQCLITNGYGHAISSEAVLTVLPDTTRPVIDAVGNLGENRILFVVFSEPVETASATDASHYTINGGITVTKAIVGIDARTILLTTTPMAANTTYTLTVNNVRDRASTPNVILPNSQATFAITTSPIDASFLSLSREPLGTSTRRHGVVISEVMYHPAVRTDDRILDYIEIYNSQPWFEDMSNWRISGAVDYVFAPGTILQSGQYLLVGAVPADLRAAYGLATVLGPFSGAERLPNDQGTLRLRNASDAVVFEMDYDGKRPFPVSADGSGHSLVLARPSYGERDARAWDASERFGGSPGAAEPVLSRPFASLFINEFLAHTDPPEVDFIELYNYGNTQLSIAGCTLSDDADTNKFVIPAGTVIAPRGFVHFTESQLGFALSAAGERIILKAPGGTNVVDAIRFEAQENGVAFGRYPDGNPEWSRLETPTPGMNNARLKPARVVFSEIMYNPASGDGDDEYVELHNPGTEAVNLGQWRLRGGIGFEFPEGTQLAPGAYLAVAKQLERLRTNHPSLTAANSMGDFSGSLGNGGERIELNFPDDIVSTNALGQLETNRVHIMMDEVSYGTGGRWGRWSDGGGSSLELRDPRSDRRRATNWGDSDETAKSPWITIETTGVLDNGWAEAYQLHVTLLGAGEVLVDDVEVIPAGGANLVVNAAFSAGTQGWVFQGNHNQSSWEPGGGGSLHVRAAGRGDTGSNRIRTQLTSTPASGTTVTLRARVRWLKGNPNVHLRLRGNWLEAVGYALTTQDLGTPGQANSIGQFNTGPAIAAVRHFPALPAAGQPVLVTAQVHDPDGLSFLALHYRLDPSNRVSALAMTNNGAGLYSAIIPGQANGATAAFHIQAQDHFDPPASQRFPADAPAGECVVRWGDTAIPSGLGAYRFWITQTNIDRWVAEEKMSNNPKDVTFVYGTNRVIYNAGAFFHGSPYHSPSYDSPVGNSADYDMHFPKDDLLLGETDINLFRPGNGGGEGTGQAEIHGNWFAAQFGAPFLYHRPMVLYVNGQRRATLYHDAQQPNGDFLRQWFPNDANGSLHKIKLGFEFGDAAYGNGEAGYAVIGANLGRYTTTGGQPKLARYRQILPLRSEQDTEENDYTNLLALIEASNTSAPVGSDAYTTTLSNATDVEEWYKVHVTQHLIGNNDSFSYGGGQNAFLYKPEHQPWHLLLWDIDFAFGGSPTDPNLLGIGGADHGPRNTHPPFARIYWQTLLEAAQNILSPSRSDAILDSRFNGMSAAGAGVNSPQGIKDFIAARRSFILGQIAANQATFSILSNGGAPFTTNRNVVLLEGTAPLEVRTLLFNGAAYPVTWTSLHAWTARIPLVPGQNAILVTGIDPHGLPVPGASRFIQVTFSGTNPLPEDCVVINEIMYHPPPGQTSFVEVHNTSATHAFDLSNWRLDGVAYTFPQGFLLEPGAHAVIVRDRAVFSSSLGNRLLVAGEFPGPLDNGGETLTLLRPGPAPDEEIVVDRVTYGDAPPWPVAADGGGASLQLLDPLQDNNRVANWAAVDPHPTQLPQTLVSLTRPWSYQQTADLTGVNWMDRTYNDASWPTGGALLYVENAALPGPKTTPLTLGRLTYYFRTHFNLAGSPAGASLKLTTMIDDGAVLYLNGQEIYRLGMPAGPVNYATLASRGVGDAVLEGPVILPGNALTPGDNVLAIEVHQNGSTSSDIVMGLTLETTFDVLRLQTPAEPNSVRAILPPFPSLWINEFFPGGAFPATHGVLDRFGEADPWIELFNGGTTQLNLRGLTLAPNGTNLVGWTFPADAFIDPGGFLVVWLDGQPAQSSSPEWHASFRADPTNGVVVLTRGPDPTSIVDHLDYRVPIRQRSFGSYPDGEVSNRLLFSAPTPGAANQLTPADSTIFINEWMADNADTLADPTDGHFDDWIELYNPTGQAVDLTGFYLSDDLANPTRSVLPMGAILPPHGYLLVWADNSPEQNNLPPMEVHADFGLSRNGDDIGLFAPDGTLVDAVHFGSQGKDQAEGRFPDGGAGLAPLTWATPREPNVLASANLPPVLASITDRTVNEGQLLKVSNAATDPEEGILTYSLDGGAPSGMSIAPASGLISWTPSESQGPGVYSVTVRATDNGVPALSHARNFTVTVREVNAPPTLSYPQDHRLSPNTLLAFAVTALDPDLPKQNFVFTLDPGAPATASLDAASGQFQWLPNPDHVGTHQMTVHVSDSGTPPLEAAGPLNVEVVPASIRMLIRDIDHGVELTFDTVPGKRYQVEYQTNIAHGTWSALTGLLPATQASLSVLDNLPPSSQRFYRVLESD